MDWIKPIVLGACGMLLALVVWHLYTDHLLIHAIVDALNRPPAPK